MKTFPFSHKIYDVLFVLLVVWFFMIMGSILNAQTNDFRYTPGNIQLNLAEEIDLSWALNQDLINKNWEGVEYGAHFRPPGEEERSVLGLRDPEDKCAVLPGFASLCWSKDFPDDLSPERKTEVLASVCKMFNRDVVSYKDKILTCGEPKPPTIEDLRKEGKTSA